MLFVQNSPLLWLPIIGVHLLFFSGLTLLNRLHNVDWQYLALFFHLHYSSRHHRRFWTGQSTGLMAEQLYLFGDLVLWFYLAAQSRD